jgi:hypothetical protein
MRTRGDHLQLYPMKRLRELRRVMLSRIFQACTRHAHTGSYYARFVPTELDAHAAS